MESSGRIANAVELVPADRDDMPEFTDRFQDYLAELARFNGARPNRHGRYEYQGFKLYWQDTTRQPYFIRVDGRRAGLVLLRELSRGIEAREGPSIQLAEFYVFPLYRRLGVARAAVRLAAGIAERNGLPLTWSAYMNNPPAVALYQAVLREFSELDRPWTVERRRGIGMSGLARYYYKMTPPDVLPT